MDVECDSDAATANYRKVFGEIRTPAWQSTRGVHHLFQWDERLAGLGAKVEYQTIEFRLGADGKATQSICPPSVVDGVKREWIVRPDECDVATLPEPIIEALRAFPRATAWDNGGPDEMFEGVYRALRAAKIAKLTDYFARTETPVVSQHVDHRGWTYLHLARCPFKHPEHGDGDPCAIVFPDGSHTFKCQHTKCINKKWPEIEEVYGALNPVIRITPNLHDNVDEAIRALATDPTILQRVGLVEVVHDAPRPKLCVVDNVRRDSGDPRSDPEGQALRPCAFREMGCPQGCVVHCLPSDPIVSATVSASHYPNIPKCLGVVSSPVLRSDGTIAIGPGYDPLTGLYIATDRSYPPLMPAYEAVALLNDLLVDFPFQSEKHRAGWFAALLTLLVRSRLPGLLHSSCSTGIAAELAKDYWWTQSR